MKGTDTNSITKYLRSPRLPGWVILPARLFLAISFISAGLDKLTDPAYLDPSARNYIGNQITGMALGTPLEGFLNNIAAPNAALFGVLVMGGELLIGLAVLFGALTRFSALMGMMLNLTFFLSATWNIHPFYFGADLPYVFLWLTLLLAGPGPLAVDSLVKKWVEEGDLIAAPAPPPPVPVKGARRGPSTQGQVRNARYAPPPPPPTDSPSVMTRRAVLGTSVAGLALAGLLSAGLGWDLLHPGGSARGAAQSSGSAGGTATATPEAPASGQVAAPPGTDTPAPASQAAPSTDTPGSQAASPPTDTPPAPTDTPAASNTAGKQLLAAPGSLPNGQALQFQLPTGEPAVLVHNDSGYSAYVAICTHQGCEVQPIQSGYLGCPCHGAIFDTNQGGQPVRGPARRPLETVPVVVGSDGGVYLGG